MMVGIQRVHAPYQLKNKQMDPNNRAYTEQKTVALQQDATYRDENGNFPQKTNLNRYKINLD